VPLKPPNASHQRVSHQVEKWASVSPLLMGLYGVEGAWIDGGGGVVSVAAAGAAGAVTAVVGGGGVRAESLGQVDVAAAALDMVDALALRATGDKGGKAWQITPWQIIPATSFSIY